MMDTPCGFFLIPLNDVRQLKYGVQEWLIDFLFSFNMYNFKYLKNKKYLKKIVVCL